MTASWLRRRWWWWLFAVFAVVVPLARLLPLDRTFAVDWKNHTWLASYAGEYLRQHQSLPVVLNTVDWLGLPYPIFYGTLFYGPMALLTSWLNAGIAIRLVVLLVTWLQFHAISGALRRLDVPRWFAGGVACLAIWAIYPLTNLYNRSAITEYVATALLGCAVATWFALVQGKPEERTRLALGFGLLFALTAGIHPITALYSLPILLLLLVAAYDQHGRDRAFWWGLVKALALPVILTVVVLAPWLAALSAFQRDLFINRGSADMPWFDVDTLDAASTRFYPLPLDVRTHHTPFAQLPSPYLDAQIAIPILILLVGLVAIELYRNRASRLAALRSVAFALVAFLGFSWLSLSRGVYDHLPSIARMIQIPYRLITYQNLSLMLGILMLASVARRRRGRSMFDGRAAPILLAACLLLTTAGVVYKWRHATRISHDDGPAALTMTRAERRTWATLPTTFYGVTDYATPGRYTSLSAAERDGMTQVWIPVGNDDAFGEPQPLHVTLPHDVWADTNVEAFPLNHLSIDGVVVADEQLRVDNVRLVVHLPAGEHVLTMATEPDATWLWLRTISFAVLALWFAGVAYLNLRPWWRRRRAARELSPARA